MADFEAPSFSLGLDFDLPDSEPHIATANKDDRADSSSNNFSVAETILVDDDDDFETLTAIDSESENHDSPPKLKRLRRGSTVEDTVSSASAKSKVDLLSSVVVDDDDIEDFSSPEDNRTDEHLSTQHHSVCKSSKFPLSGHGVLTKQSGNRNQTGSSAPESVITSNKPPFPKLSASPLRRFQLIDSDSDFDDPYISEGATKKTYNGSEPYLKLCPPDLVQCVGLNEQRKLNESIKTSTEKDLWGDFRPEKSFRIPTPALDEVCEEYFSSMKDKRTSQSNVGKNSPNIHVTNSVIDLGDPRPPAHQYFFHSDPRVQDLVRTRLPNFFPINAENKNSEQPSTSNIDYMGQFNCGENSKQAARTNKAETSSRKNSQKSTTQETSQGFTNPKLNTEKRVPKDAGKRRVQADGQSAGAGKRRVQADGQSADAGHWFTNQDGKRVYVSKNGQELTGRPAYILYKKESGAGFKNKKAKKTSTKNK
ncbi:hypothetical protein L1987_26558 [Smallanthus sonchifolius]|uniref:Uncharacterized protein n=1 Tax=Smallanthus sonchifolius TaxID=185202 RepID=A0ACB9IBA8_9ASTR|nr:hypothetical protein L1987_26558 [Smallanthus sonchifolius]